MEDVRRGLSHIRQLFIKHAEGRTTPEEESLLLDYLADGDADALPEVDELVSEKDSIVMDKAVSENMVQHILSVTDPAARRPVRPLLRWLAAAVMLGIIVCIGLWPKRTAAPVWCSVQTGYGQLRVLTLPDGSKITLNGHSVLRYDSLAIHGPLREVWLNGEAFFDIAPVADAQFVVHAGDSVEVRVLGTQFNVRYTGQRTTVVLNSGKVKIAAVTAGKKAEILLQPGEMAVYDAPLLQLRQQPADTVMSSSWKQGQQYFQQTYLQEVTQWMEEQFGITVTYARPELKTLPFSGTIPSGDLERIIPILEKSLDIKIDKSERQLIVRPAH